MALTDNLCILHDDAFSRANITVATEAGPTTPATNLQTPERWKRWRSSADAIQRIYATISDADIDNQVKTGWGEIVGDGSSYLVWSEMLWDGKPIAGRNIRPGDSLTLTMEGKVDQAAFDNNVSVYAAVWINNSTGWEVGYGLTFTETYYVSKTKQITIENWREIESISFGLWHSPALITAGNVYTRKVKLLKHPPGELAMAIVDHNFPPRTVVKVQGWHDAADGVDLAFDVAHEIQSDWTDLAPGVIDRDDNYLLNAVDNRVTLIPLGVAELPKFIKISFARQGTNFTAFPGTLEASRILFGRLWRPQTNLSWGARIQHKRIEDAIAAAAGNLWLNPIGTRRETAIPLQWLNAQDRDTLIGIYNLSRGQPIVVGLHPTGDGAAATFDALYCRMTDLIRSRRTATRSLAEIRLEEVL